MSKADSLAVASGVPSIELMENAGQAVVAQIMQSHSPRATLILCGPGNNGGDGFVVARLLQQKGWQVELALLGDVAQLKGDAKINAIRFNGEIKIFAPNMLDKAELIIDAIFGAGLDREIIGEIASIINQVNQADIPVISIDIPSGIDGETGQVLGVALRAKQSVTFFRAKPAHYLMPARIYCGEITIVDIGIPESVLQEITANTWLNNVNLWQLPCKKLDEHKYDAGHCLVISGDELHGGAARLAARAALRIGAGLVSIVGTRETLLIHAAQVSAIMLRQAKKAQEIAEMLSDKRLNSTVIGMGLGIGKKTREKVLATLKNCANVVIDADGLSSFAQNPEQLFDAIKARNSGGVVLTPHAGEFCKIFNITSNSKVEKACMAAKISGATIVYKGADSVIAAPNGWAAINNNAPPELATAGSGDVLAGIIGGLMAQGMQAHLAAAAGVYLHGAAAASFAKAKSSAGLISDDLPSLLPKVMQSLHKTK